MRLRSSVGSGRLLEDSTLAGVEDRRRRTRVSRGRIVEQHRCKPEERFFPGKVTVPEAIDWYVQTPGEQRTRSQGLERIEKLVRVRYLLVTRRMERNQGTAERTGCPIGRIHRRDRRGVCSNTLHDDIQQEVILR